MEYLLPEGRIFTSTPPHKVTATVEGTGWKLLAHFTGRDEMDIQLGLANNASQTINGSQIKAKIQQLLDDVTVMDIEMDYIQIDLDEASQSKVPIQLEQQISFREGFQLRAPIRLSPDSVLLTGPASLIARHGFWPTLPLQLDDLSSNVQPYVDLLPPEDPVLQIQPVQCQVLIQVEQFTEKSGLFVPITVRNAPDSIKIFPEKIELRCVVGLSRFKDVSSRQFELVADLKNISLNSANNTVPIQLTRSPDFVSRVRFSRQSVEFFFVKE
ncbi:MAG: hypothetical protein AAFV95_16150 [Bacteroidota bacterium]